MAEPCGKSPFIAVQPCSPASWHCIALIVRERARLSLPPSHTLLAAHSHLPRQQLSHNPPPPAVCDSYGPRYGHGVLQLLCSAATFAMASITNAAGFIICRM